MPSQVLATLTPRESAEGPGRSVATRALEKYTHERMAACPGAGGSASGIEMIVASLRRSLCQALVHTTPTPWIGESPVAVVSVVCTLVQPPPSRECTIDVQVRGRGDGLSSEHGDTHLLDLALTLALLDGGAVMLRTPRSTQEIGERAGAHGSTLSGVRVWACGAGAYHRLSPDEVSALAVLPDGSRLGAGEEILAN